jgi:membrane protein
MEIPGLRGVKVRTLLKSTLDEFLSDDMLTYAAAMAYHLFFALFPFVLFLLALLSFLDLTTLFESMLAQARRALPNEAYREVERVIAEVEGQRRGGLLSFGLVVSVWTASIGMRSAMNALNQAYDIPEGRSRLKRYSFSIVYTLGFTLLVILATALLVFGPLLTASLAARIGLGGVVITLWTWLRLPVALLLAMVAVSLVYYFAPNLKERFRVVTPGSVIAVLLWALMSVLFQFYVSNFGRYSVTYGSVGAVIILLLYFFLSSSLLLLGGEINAVIRSHAPRPDDPEVEA